MQYLPLILLYMFIPWFIVRPVTTLVHELGHAIPALILTGEGGALYLGSYGDPTKSLRLKIGRLRIFLRYNLFRWNTGLFVKDAKDVPINHQIIYVLSGSLTSFLLAAVACYFAFFFGLHGFLKLLFITFLISAIWDLFANLIPSSTPIMAHDGDVTYNDGRLLKTLFRFKRYSDDYSRAVSLYEAKKFTEVIDIIESLKQKWGSDGNISRLGLCAELELKNYVKAKCYVDEIMRLSDLAQPDYLNAGYVCIRLGLNEEAMGYLDKALQLSPNDLTVLNNKGYLLAILEQYHEAIPFLDRAIEIDPNYAHAYNNRGLARYKTGEVESGLADIYHSISLDAENPYTYRNLGVYYLDINEPRQALEFFEKANEFDNAPQDTNTLMEQARRKLQA
jgi:tetratricopeptide (TPR) repeat protein